MQKNGLYPQKRLFLHSIRHHFPMRQNKLIVIFCFFALFFGIKTFSQKKFLSTRSESVIKTFSTDQKSFQWAFPISNEETLPLVWKQKSNSFSSAGILTFVGYQQEHFKAVATIKGTSFSAILTLPSREISLKTDADGLLFVEDTKRENAHCGNCMHGSCSASVPNSVFFSSNISEPATPKMQEFTTDTGKGYADTVLRIYRLAMPITYEYFSTKFNQSVEEVYAFWAQTETALNEIYVRDISVKFEVVQNENLIIQSSYDPINALSYKRNAEDIIKNSTKAINNLIGENSYDVAIVIGKNSQLTESPRGDSGLLGLAGVGSAYLKSSKGQGIATVALKTIAHELGHMFGAEHTFSVANGQIVRQSLKTEVDAGESVMSYGSPMDFFSLPSIGEQIKPILGRMPYYADRERTNMVGTPFTKDRFFHNNASFGIKTPNQAPTINKNGIKSEYTIPQGTFFQFYINATDADGHKLSYMANPADIKTEYQLSNARFLTFPATENNWIAFQTMYQEDFQRFEETLIEKPNSTPSKQEGSYTFWLAVRDSDTSLENHATAYDFVQTKVNIVSGTPFKLTNSFEKAYNAKDKILLKWNVDEKIFPKTTKVRILLSDDFGKTFKHTIVSSTENDGEHEITLPNISIGTIDWTSTFTQNIIKIPAGIIKIEVIGELAYDVSATRPYSLRRGFDGRFQGEIMGGFTLIASGIELQNTPENEIFVTCNNIPPKAEVRAVSRNCTEPNIKLEFKEEGKKADCENYTFTRTWTATDACGNTESFEQTIRVIPELRFVGELPQNIAVSCDDIPAPQMLTATGGCSDITISYTETDGNTNCETDYQIVRTWVAIDGCENRISHTQIISVVPKVMAYNAVSLEENSRNYLKFSNVKTGHLIIFDEMGMKIFESKNYGENGDIFKGYSNIKGSFIENKPVSSGTYFYIFTYRDAKGEEQHLKGFLFVG